MCHKLECLLKTICCCWQTFDTLGISTMLKSISFLYRFWGAWGMFIWCTPNLCGQPAFKAQQLTLCCLQSIQTGNTQQRWEKGCEITQVVMEKQLEDKLGKRKGCSSLILSSGSGWAVPPYLEIAVVVLLPFPRLGLGPHLHRGTARDATAVSSQTFVVFPAK